MVPDSATEDVPLNSVCRTNRMRGIPSNAFTEQVKSGQIHMCGNVTY
jgi:hypothetical protein